MWPQVVFAVIYAAIFLKGASKGGGEFWSSLVACVFAVFVLYEGGFWAPIGLAP